MKLIAKPAWILIWVRPNQAQVIIYLVKKSLAKAQLLAFIPGIGIRYFLLGSLQELDTKHVLNLA